jgi:SAM-dependent methyltransferase
MNGLGIDIADIALEQARKRVPVSAQEALEEGIKLSPGLQIQFIKQGAEEILPVEDQSVDVVLDMMVSHQLVRRDRESLVKEVARVLKPYGWLFFKTFVLEGDAHARRMIDEHKITKDYKDKHPEYFNADGDPESRSYIHPHTKGFEHVYTEDEIAELFAPYFKIYKMKKSYKHVKDGKAFKRRTVSVYMERLRD